MVVCSYIGLDFSTQQLKLVGVNEDLAIVYDNFVKFDDDLPHYRTEDGCIRDGLCATVPTIMWVEALDKLLEKAKEDGLDFQSVKALSGAAQQHGSVYWRDGAEEILKHVDPSIGLAPQLKDCFSFPNGPIWMDGSTTAQCQKLENTVGGSEALSSLTGSVAYERFSGSQILKRREENSDAYSVTERITLVSSFASTLFCGCYTHIDISDGAGMNLMNIRTKEWVDILCKLIGGDLEKKLGTVQSSGAFAGQISHYFQKRYGFSDDCKVVNFTGDNPGSLAGMRLQEGDLCLSLGTSDVLMLWLRNCPTNPSYACVFGNPVKSDEYMAILCFKNGSLVRDRLKNVHANKEWSRFSELLQSVPKGNNGKIGIYFDEMEIIPRNQKGTYRYNENDDLVTSEFSPAEEIRALLESQILARFMHAQQVGFKTKEGARILATGGASVNKDLMQIVADVFQLNVYNVEVANSAALGSAYRCKHALEGGSFQSVVEHIGEYQLVASPDPETIPVYEKLLKRYKKIEENLKME